MTSQHTRQLLLTEDSDADLNFINSASDVFAYTLSTYNHENLVLHTNFCCEFDSVAPSPESLLALDLIKIF